MTRLVLALLAACVALLGVAPTASVAGASATVSAPDPGDPSVVVLGAPGLSMRDLSAQQTPTLWSQATEGATADLVVRGGYLQTCGVDGWLSLGAGGRVAFPRPGSPDLTDPEAAPVCPEVGTTPVGAVEGWSGAVDLGEERKGDATLGVLADSLRAGGTCVEASGGPGASIGAADGRGEIGDGSAGCAVRLVDVGEVEGEGGSRQAQVREVDAAVAEATADLPAETLVVVAGLGDSGTGPALRALVYSGGGDPRSNSGIEPGALASATTRRTGVVQLPDVTADLLHRVGAEPVAPVAGRPLTLVRDDRGTAQARVERQADVAGQLETASTSIPPFFRGLAAVVVGAVLLASLALVALRHRPAGRAALTHVVRVGALVLASVPAATFVATLAPWWSGEHPTPALAAWTGVGAVALAALALGVTLGRAPWGLTAVGVIGGATAVLLALDLVLRDGQAIFLGVLGLHPWDGGRFYGFGNVPFALFATGALLATTALLDPVLRAGQRRAATVLAAVCGLAVLVVDAAPFAGADGGGTLALVPAVGYLVLAVSGARVTLVRLLLIGVATVVGFLAVAGLDYLRPEDERSHLGRFFGRVLTGDAWEVVERKLMTNVEMLLGPERAALLVPVGLVLVIWALARPGSRLARPLSGALERHPALRPGLISLVVALTAGFLLNDSGTAIPAVASIILVPSLLVLALGAGRAPTRSP